MEENHICNKSFDLQSTRKKDFGSSIKGWIN